MKKLTITISACLLLVFGGAQADDDPLSQLIFNNFSIPTQGEQGNDGSQAEAPVKSKSDDMLMSALSLIGVKYRFGGNTPETGLDCSGFVRYVVSQSLGMVLPRSAAEIAGVGKMVGMNELQPGDLVFFNTMRRTFSHVGIYLGDGKFIHSPRAGKSVQVVSISDSYWVKRFDGARRLSIKQ